jgi:hypothetical protein
VVLLDYVGSGRSDATAFEPVKYSELHGYAQDIIEICYALKLSQAKHPVLVFQSSVDTLAALSVGEYVVNSLPEAELEVIPADGHCLHMTHPDALAPSLVRFALAE